MKKLVINAFAVIMMIGALAVNANAQSPTGCAPSEGAAIQAVRQACGNQPPQGMQYVASLQVASECEGGGCSFLYNVYLVGRCTGNIDPALCDPIRILVGQWSQGCSGFSEIICY